MTERTAQPGIFAQGTPAHYHLEFDCSSSDPAAIGEAVAALREPAVTAGGVNLVVAFGPALWRRLAADDAPEDLHDFAPIQGAHVAPATQHDVYVWAHGASYDVVFDIARAVVVALARVATLATEQPSFVYLDSRDLTGFIDGTENPPAHEAPGVAVVAEGPGAGGSFVILQRWVHHLGAFHALSLEEQEGVIGRRKADSVELDDDQKPDTAHIARVVIEEDGEELEIYRRSTPFGTVGEHGLQFVGFSADPSRFDKMLARMFGTTGDGLHDHLTDFSTPVTGAYYFAPSLEALADLG
ncbi:MAG: Dyp-type peroxidase [Acidimicrobiia bacterium]|jgi:putative iron-dependent peroxidase